MKRSWIFPVFFAALFVGAAGVRHILPSSSPEGAWDKNTPVATVLASLGDLNPNAPKPDGITDALVTQGHELFTTGMTSSPDGKVTQRQSRYFLCTNCHNTQREDPDLRLSDPETRLEFADANGLPLLQGTTMWGTVNRSSWYNGDYFKKYGDLVKPANQSLEEAIHLCATVCSQGRDFEDWEMKAMLAYFWSLEMKLGDLDLQEADWAKLKGLQKAGKPDAEAAKWLKSFYLTYSPATFDNVVQSKTNGYGMKGDAKRGERIYRKSCGACHYEGGPSKYLTLDSSPLTLKFLQSHLDHDSRFSVYEIVRKGTHSFDGHKAYMPHYTLERMSNKQVEDLRAYITSASN